MSKEKVSILKPRVPESEDSLQVVETIDERKTPELVFGLVGAMGSGVSTTAKNLKNILQEEYGYGSVNIIKVSDLIIENAKKVKLEIESGLSPEDKTEQLQNIGNKLRETFGTNYLIEKCVEKIAHERSQIGFEQNTKKPKILRHAHIIDSLKNPAEAELLKKVYGDIFWSFTVFAPYGIRRERLKGKGYKLSYLDKLFERDENEDNKFGQKVRDTAHQSDFFIRNDKNNEEKLNETIQRFLHILFNIKVNTPTRHETAMFKAVASAARSACLSRQVGASIYSGDGELLGVGCNDVPKPFGGVYSTEDGNDDHRCYLWKGKICHNEAKKNTLYSQLFKNLREMLKDDISEEIFKKKVKATDIKNLVEFSRSVHAEMEAIISVARTGKGILSGAIMYCTTFPCHNCARHIVASGIQKVIYIEPYPKSLALELHDDSIATLGADRKKVRFLQYEGVAPRKIIRLFYHGQKRKKNGKIIDVDKKASKPVSNPSIDDYTTHEKLIVAKLLGDEEKVLLKKGD